MEELSTPKTLEEAMNELVSRIHAIGNLLNTIDEKWGVTLAVTAITYTPDGKPVGSATLKRGIEELENVFGKKVKQESYSRDLRKLFYKGIEFHQFADDKTGVFVKAGKKPPKVVIVEDEE